MFYLGIDQHRKQLTVNLRDEDGGVIGPAAQPPGVRVRVLQARDTHVATL